jgi:3-oxoadipate CoA-transferase alpha subunit
LKAVGNLTAASRTADTNGVRRLIDKICTDAASALSSAFDGAAVMIGGFGSAGMPEELVDALIATGVRNLTIITNNAGNGETGIAALIAAKCLRRIICSFPRQADSHHFDAAYRTGALERELVPQGNLAARIQAASAGLGAIYTPTGVGTLLAEGKEIREIDGRSFVFELPIHADIALVCAASADRWGNLTYNKTARNFGPIMAMAACETIAQVDRIVEMGSIDPEAVVTPGIFVQKVVAISPPVASVIFEEAAA